MCSNTRASLSTSPLCLRALGLQFLTQSGYLVVSFCNHFFSIELLSPPDFFLNADSSELTDSMLSWCDLSHAVWLPALARFHTNASAPPALVPEQ